LSQSHRRSVAAGVQGPGAWVAARGAKCVDRQWPEIPCLKPVPQPLVYKIVESVVKKFAEKSFKKNKLHNNLPME
jgi:hypothetical protein